MFLKGKDKSNLPEGCFSISVHSRSVIALMSVWEHIHIDIHEHRLYILVLLYIA